MNVAVLAQLGVEAQAPNDERSSAGAAARRHHAWQSAMEQAQLADWFKPGRDAGDAQEQSQEKTGEAAAKLSAAPAPSQGAFMPGVDRGAEALAPRSASSIAISQALRSADTPGAADDVTAGRGSIDATLLHSPAPVAQAIPLGVAVVVKNIGAEVQRYVALAGFDAAQGTAAATKSVATTSTPVGLNVAQLETVAFRATLPTTPLLSEVEKVPAQDVIGESGEETVPSVGRAAIKFTGTDEAAPPVRVHVDWSEQGARIWLGVDQERMPSVPGLVRHLDQWLSTSGVKLSAIVCNGRTVYTRYSPRRPE